MNDRNRFGASGRVRHHPSLGIEFIEFFEPMFRPDFTAKQFGRATKPFPAFPQTSGNSGWLSNGQ
jgi:hypothetical protein